PAASTHTPRPGTTTPAISIGSRMLARLCVVPSSHPLADAAPNDTRPLLQHGLGVVLTRLGRWDEAEEALKAALRLENYTYAEASYNLGRLYALRGEAGLAIAEWQRTLHIKPDHADAAIALARTLAEDGDPEQGLAVLDSFGARMSKRGAVAPREVAVARGEIIAATNVAADTGRAKS